ncbi:hypothetical protein BY458DRAFT_530263 [Sporodiniella umbellata]|nr:hypothetical protein BY458DRAFT_530263 [Sporodiniella umbellata]
MRFFPIFLSGSVLISVTINIFFAVLCSFSLICLFCFSVFLQLLLESLTHLMKHYAI